jgi:hypothetical protein
MIPQNPINSGAISTQVGLSVVFLIVAESEQCCVAAPFVRATSCLLILRNKGHESEPMTIKTGSRSTDIREK